MFKPFSRSRTNYNQNCNVYQRGSRTHAAKQDMHATIQAGEQQIKEAPRKQNNSEEERMEATNVQDENGIIGHKLQAHASKNDVPRHC